MGIYKSIDQTIGGTPLVQLDPPNKYRAEVVAKLEYQNPGGSVKDRLALGTIREAEQRGDLNPGSTIVEATSGNTGIGLAMIAAARGYSLILAMPESMSLERRKLLLAYGAELVLTPADQGMKGAIAKAEEIAGERGGFLIRQFENPANVQIHYQTTGPEIETDTQGRMDALVAGVGTGGTLGGAGKYLKQKNANLEIVAVEPAESPVISGGKPGNHKIQGIGAGFIPSILDPSLIDKIVTVTTEDAVRTARGLAMEHGVLAGISSGANLFAARKIARDLAAKEGSGLEQRVVVILPSNGERYLSTVLYEDLDVGTEADSVTHDAPLPEPVFP